MSCYYSLAVGVVEGVGAGEDADGSAADFGHYYKVAEGLRFDDEEALVAVGVDLFEGAADFVLDVCPEVCQGCV